MKILYRQNALANGNCTEGAEHLPQNVVRELEDQAVEITQSEKMWHVCATGSPVEKSKTGQKRILKE